jgi:hypothetical protein
VIGIFSDSHGDLGAFAAAYELLSAKGATRFFFAGGRYGDLDNWLAERRARSRGGDTGYSDQDFLTDVSSWLGKEAPVQKANQTLAAPAPGAVDEEDLNKVRDRFLRVPERGSIQFLDPNVPQKAVDMIGSTLCCLVYDKNDLSKEDMLNATYFIHGRSPEPKVVQIGTRYFVTPGRLTGAAEQTCALLEPKGDTLLFSAFTLEGRVLVDAQGMALDRKTKLSVK